MSVSEVEIRAAHARWKRRRRRLIGYGQWEPFVDAAPVRAHVEAIHAAGMSFAALCRVRDLPQGALKYLLWGTMLTGGKRLPPAKQVRRELAEALLSYWPALDDFPDDALIDPCGFRRRMEALMANGITLQVIAPRCGMNPNSLSHAFRAKRVRAQLVRVVRDLYDEWWDADPEDLGVKPGMAERQRRQAVKRGFVPALAWDEETIDDPDAVPVLDAAKPEPSRDADAVDRFLMGESLVLDVEGRRAALRYLMEWTDLTAEDVGQRLGIDGESVKRSWERIVARARQAGEPVPWRRAYVAPVAGDLRVGARELDSVA